MKKTLLSTLICLSAIPGAFADCAVEMQYQGSVLGQNIFMSQNCIDATRECMKTLKMMERQTVIMRGNAVQGNFFQDGELQCVKVGDVISSPNPTGTTTAMSRYEAIQILENIEGDTAQADQDFNLIMSYVENGEIYLRDGVDVFVTVMNALGASQTTNVQNIFRDIMTLQKTTNTLPIEIANLYVSNFTIENDAIQANDNVKLVASLLGNSSELLFEAVNEFNRLLSFAGASKTNETRQLYTSLVTKKYIGNSLAQVVATAIEVERLENNLSQTRENMDLVNRAVTHAGADYQDASSTMLALLKRYGASNTTTVQSKFKMIYKI